jgi:hypothetical protein
VRHTLDIPRSQARPKSAIACVAFKPVCRGSLRGFASIAFIDLKMTVNGIGIPVHDNGSSWAQPPAQAWIKDGNAVRDDRSKVVYSPPLLEFGNAAVRRAWSNRVVEAVVAFDSQLSNAVRARDRSREQSPQSAASGGPPGAGREALKVGRELFAGGSRCVAVG